ncbi:MAG: hypothetical protein GX753_00915 [Erysipelothrix sp.]|nr:hypothetical protein [Erysipelothrix sp.]
MNVEYINKNGYIVETDRAVYVFDYVEGRLPAAYLRNGKPLLFFVSNNGVHHYSESIYNYRKTVVLSYDVDVTPYSRVFKMKSNEMIHLGFAKVYSFSDLNEGISYAIVEDDVRVFFGGRLNMNENDSPYQNELYFDLVHKINKYAPYTIAILEVNINDGMRYMEGAQYFINHCKPRHLFPLNFGELDGFNESIRNRELKFYMPKFSNHKFEVENV